MKLDLGSGPKAQEGYIGVDLCGGSGRTWYDLDKVQPGDVVSGNLRSFPWP